MSLNPNEQFVEAIQRSRSVAVVFRAAWSGDSLGTALAMARFVGKQGKQVELVCDGFKLHSNFSFLPGIETVQPTLQQSRHLTLTFNLEKTKLHGLTYEIRDNHLHVTLTPKEGVFDPSLMQTNHGAFKHDLIICIDAPDLASLGALARDHREFFERTPIIVIDHDPSNERYGAVNFVDMRASSTAEVAADLIEAIDPKCVDAEISTALLTGLICETKSFRTANVTPRTLSLASRLVDAGGRRGEIVERLFRTRPVETLRLWGRVLARLKADREYKIVWSLLARTDFVHAGADETHLADVIDELISNSPDAEVVCILHEHPTNPNIICGIVSTERAKDAMQLAASWNPQGHHRLARIEVKDSSLPVLEAQVISGIRQSLAATR